MDNLGVVMVFDSQPKDSNPNVHMSVGIPSKSP